LAVYGPQFGTRNDKEIVKDDPNVNHVWTGWLRMSCGGITLQMAEWSRIEVRI
jgi:hypothetical protein